MGGRRDISGGYDLVRIPGARGAAIISMQSAERLHATAVHLAALDHLQREAAVCGQLVIAGFVAFASPSDKAIVLRAGYKNAFVPGHRIFLQKLKKPTQNLCSGCKRVFFRPAASCKLDESP